MKVFQVLASFVLVLTFHNFGYAESPDTPESIFDVMGKEEVLQLSIYTDLDTVIAYRRKNETISSSMSFITPDGQVQTLNVNLTTRGKYRRLHCEVPPLKLDFKKKDLEKIGLARFDDYKLVSQCESNPKLARELIMREYLAYQLYNELTEYIYQVQLVQITYRNPDTGKEDDQWGFLIEDTAELSTRVGFEKADHHTLPIDSFHQEELKILSLFQDMIGNVDWGINPTKNVKYFRKDGKFIPIAYDFDFSALVAAPYAETTRLRNEDRQILMGQHTDLRPEIFGSGLTTTLSYFQSRQKDLNAIIQNSEYLSKRVKKEMIQVLDAFFDDYSL